MWIVPSGFLFGRAVKQSRALRLFLAVILFGCLVFGLIYASAIFKAVNERSHDRHVISPVVH
jgi:hypothetical protein